MEKLRKVIVKLTGLKSEEVIEALKYENELNPHEKNLVFNYLSPRFIRDYELPKLIYERRGINQSGFLDKNIGELRLLVEAYRCPQYSRYIKHLMYSYSNPEIIFPISGTETQMCGVCNKNLFEFDAWDKLCKDNPSNPEVGKREYLAFGSSDTKITICLDCLVQLNYLQEFLDVVEPDRYKPTKREFNEIKPL